MCDSIQKGFISQNLITRTEGIYPDSVSVKNTEKWESVSVDRELLGVDGWVKRVFCYTSMGRRGICGVKSCRSVHLVVPMSRPKPVKGSKSGVQISFWGVSSCVQYDRDSSSYVTGDLNIVVSSPPF